MAQVQLMQNAAQRPPIVRTMTVGISVEQAADLPKAGRELAKFLAVLDTEHGAFDIAIDVLVGGYERPQIPSGLTVINNHSDYEEVD